MLVYGAPNKITLRSLRTGEERLVDIAMVAVVGVVLVLVYVVRGTVVRERPGDRLVHRKDAFTTPETRLQRCS